MQGNGNELKSFHCRKRQTSFSPALTDGWSRIRAFEGLGSSWGKKSVVKLWLFLGNPRLAGAPRCAGAGVALAVLEVVKTCCSKGKDWQSSSFLFLPFHRLTPFLLYFRCFLAMSVDGWQVTVTGVRCVCQKLSHFLGKVWGQSKAVVWASAGRKEEGSAILLQAGSDTGCFTRIFFQFSQNHNCFDKIFKNGDFGDGKYAARRWFITKLCKAGKGINSF